MKKYHLNLNQHQGLAMWLVMVLFVLFAQSTFANEYGISPEDIVNITVYDEPELSVQETRVSSNGTVAMPLIGDVRVTGLTTTQVAAKIEALLANGYLKKPRVSVSIYEYRQVFVNGEVKKPGGYSYQEGLTVQKAVVLAGGFTERASPSKISLVREDRPGMSVPVSQNDSVKPGDIITVGESFF